MWIQNADTGKWTLQTETLTKSNYDNLKQDLESVRLYSKILSGATYLTINKFDNIYDILDYKTGDNWYVSSTYSSVGSTPSVSATPINTTSSYDYYNKELAEYGFTLKNMFTPVKLINDSVNNFYFVDLATTEAIEDLNASLPTLVVDGVIAKNGHRILVKNQISYANLAVGVDPTTYFTGNYYKYQDNITYITYYYFDNTNGVYKYDNNQLVREDDLNSYTQSHRYSVSVKNGNTYADAQFSLSRLLNGYYPTVNDADPIEFTQTHNYVVKNRVDYNNIYSVNYNDLLTHGTQSVYVDSITYTVTPRTLAVGNFGVIINNQLGFSSSNISHIITNKYKDNIHSISQNNNYYWTCGDNGTLLRISKLDFHIERINLNELNKLNCVNFLNDIKGVVVGDFNTIYITDDGGYNWKKISFEVFDAYSYNTVYYYNLTKFYVGGDNGVFIEFNFDGTEWIAYKRKIKKTLTPGDDYNLVEDINDIKYRKYTTWGLTYSTSGGTGISTTKEMLFIATNNDNLILYNINNFVPEFPFMYLTWTQSHSDIKNVLISGHTIYLGGDNVYKFTIDDFTTIGTVSNVLVSTTGSSILFNGTTNRMNINNDSSLITLSGNLGLLDTLNVTSSVYTPLDRTFTNSINPKMLFLDYDIASKLNFFDNNNDYVLPSQGSLTSSYLVSGTLSTISIDSLPNQYSWIDYYQDVDKTFAYYTSIDDVNAVVFSTTFSYAVSSSFTFSSTDITNNVSIIKNFAPNIDSKTASRFIQGTTSITSLYAATYSVMLNKYLSIFERPTTDSFNVGDVLNISNEIIDCNFKINRIISISYSGASASNYLYCYTEFNNSIISSLLNYNGVITVNNLNKFNNINQLVSNFNKHTIGIGYKMSSDSNNIYINGTLNNKTAYYNLQAAASLSASYSGTAIYIIATMSYPDNFLNFGYVPTYNILDYLQNIDSTTFAASKRHYTMPRLQSLSGNAGNSFTSSNIYMDLNYPTNKMIFGSNLKLEYDSIWLDTFVDINLMTTVPPSLTISTFSTTRMLITKKYVDDNTGGYAIEFDKKFNVTYGSGLVVNYIDILSRNTLSEISSDLQQLNNIQRSYKTKIIQNSHTITNLENELNSKISTDSYAKILLSDNDYKTELTSIVYVDYKKELSMNVVNLDKQYTIPIINTGTYSNLPNLRITCSEPHNLNTNDAVVLTFNGGTGSSQFINPNYTGYQTVTVIDNYNFYTTKNFGVVVTVSDIGSVKFYKIDPFFNYEPVDLINVGIDKNVKTAVAINPENYQLDVNNFNLINIDLNKYRYQLTDGVSINDINSKFTWILDADVTDAVIGQDENGVVWYSGTWNGGRWFNGSWYSGTWVSGDWYNGNWYSYKSDYVNLKTQVDKINITDNNSKWLDGRWFGGTWSGGTWYNGRRYDGNWYRGLWFNGIWNDGNWIDGNWMGGIWVDGTWHDGIFNCDNKPSYWINGNWYGGDFENGIWYNGVFNQTKDKLSRFGTNASNSRTALWHSGTWVTGEFHSKLNLDINGKTLNSINNKYSMFKTGNWLSGYWYGGIAVNINFNSSNWNSGILDEIEIIGIESVNNNLILNGIFRFNINDTVYIIDNNVGNSYSVIGSNITPGKYLVANTAFTNTTTILTLNYNLSSLFGSPVNISNTDTGLRMVSYFKNSNWNKGVWYNGIFDNGSFNGGMWYNGVFNSDGIWNY